LDERLGRRRVEAFLDDDDVTPIPFELGVPLVYTDFAEAGTLQHFSAGSIFDKNPR
jgi:hypothetical protein